MTADASTSPTLHSPIARLASPAHLRWLALLLLVAGLGLRLFDLTDQPLDFHPTRQLRGAIVARGMYYQMLPDVDPDQREKAVAYWLSTGQYEPPFLERLVAVSYLALGSEQPWLARLYNSLFWLLGGLALFDLARRGLQEVLLKDTREGPGAQKNRFVHLLLSSQEFAVQGAMWGGLAALAYYLVLPFAVQASRSFQPDPMMVMGLVLAVWALYRWAQDQTWGWALAAGLLGGLAVVVKVMAAYPLGGTALGLVLAAVGLRRAVRHPQVWAMALLFLLPSGLYYLGRSGRAGEFLNSWTVELAGLLVQPSFYARWLGMLGSLMGWWVLPLGLLGVLLAPRRLRALLLGLWGGYFVYGLFLPYQVHTHSYYHLMVVPILGLSLAPVAAALAAALAAGLAGRSRLWQIVVAGAALLAVLYPSYVSLRLMASEDYRHEPAYWQEIASYLPNDGKIIAVTQDYGYRLMYYGWRKVKDWPIIGERRLAQMRGKGKEFDDYFAQQTEGASYFLVTAFNQFDRQPDLQEHLRAHYLLVAQAQGYLIFDLQQPLP